MCAIPLPSAVAKLAESLQNDIHPGLLLDKYAQTYEVRSDGPQRDAVKAVCEASRKSASDPWFAAVIKRHDEALDHVGAARVTAKTAGPFTLHLAKASALENAGICLHPIYGFVYLPGSGVKGMARAFASTVWKPQQSDASVAQTAIENVFGNEPGEPDEDRQCAAAIVFHDAWPVKVPHLVSDIVNNHHRDYYEGKDAPGDWENPVPVNFLSVEQGATFSFALSKRTADVADDLLELARRFLIGALMHLGVGAKTNAGYGRFEIVAYAEPVRESTNSVRKIWTGATTGDAAIRVEKSFPLELVTPAFLAGAAQEDRTDCDLRPATLRGLLRWWWRTMHSGYVDNDKLREMEAAVWGNTEAGGPIALRLKTIERKSPVPFNFKDRYDPKPGFKRDNHLANKPAIGTQGLFYIAYGMDEIDKTGQVKRRHFLPPGSRWELSFTARNVNMKDLSIPASAILSQAELALGLLCHFGGVGSKSRNGFGSFADIPGFDVDKALSRSFSFRKKFFGIGETNARFVESSSWASPGTFDHEIPVPWKNAWFVLDQIGLSLQSFANRFSHEEVKELLGLPRKIHGPRKGKLMKHQKPETHRDPIELRCAKGERYASPLHVHVAKGVGGGHVIRFVRFDAPALGARLSAKDKADFIANLTRHVGNDMEQRKKVHPAPGDVAKFKSY